MDRDDQKTSEREPQDFWTPISFIWPVLILIPILQLAISLPETEYATKSMRFFIGTFYFWLPFYLMYLAVFAILSSLRAETWSSALISATVALSLVYSWCYFGGVAFRLF